MTGRDVPRGLLYAQIVSTGLALLIVIAWWGASTRCAAGHGVIGFGLAGGLLVLGLFFPFLAPVWLQLRSAAVLPVLWLLLVCYLAVEAMPRLCAGETPLGLAWPVALAGLAIAFGCRLAGRYLHK
ncbi:hypothetical protein [Gemmobacter lutimaris]|uniref:hypothetical protein n=1 Tax=Gemmobacter lutimaris TaxID=2306023 RepID=UPI000E5B100E|nr:hypothetical protein [Gemmobacter lutimaris]